MKRLCKSFLACVMLAALCANCSTPDDGNKLIGGPVAPLPDNGIINPLGLESIIIADGGYLNEASYSLVYGIWFNYNDIIFDKQWLAEKEELRLKVREQCANAGADGVKKGVANLVFAPLVDLSVTADRFVCGRGSGEELIDLFYISLIEHPHQFTYPEGDLIDPNYTDLYKLFEAEDWIGKNYMCPWRFDLILKSQNDSKEFSGATITIKVTLGDGQKLVGTTTNK
ncbi:MAG: hypothetical protein J6R10_00575 [Tidjanibacter sp.]|nr:hypothetical protein [Tidjanibacter sp.]